MISSPRFFKPFFLCFFGILMLTQMPSVEAKSPTKSMARNNLQLERSPYLSGHGDNPVWWQAWNQTTLDHAKASNRLIFLSIGYTACHWCHVMERDSFMSESIAKALNKSFVSIKVDREERPDLDHVYVSAVQMMAANAGWPLNLILTPDLQIVWGGTFLERKDLQALLENAQRLWTDDPKGLSTKARKASAHVRTSLKVKSVSLLNTKVNRHEYDRQLNAFFTDMAIAFDTEFGGFGKAPKFPQPQQLRLLAQLYHRSRKPAALQMIEETVLAMIKGGIYDHVGGGFHRYATDQRWRVPHFEKMLYDNAQMSIVLLELYQITKKPLYKLIASRTLDFMQAGFRDPSGGFYSSIDADSNHQEGGFYVWQQKELQSVLDKSQYRTLSLHFDIHSKGNLAASSKAQQVEKIAGYKELADANILYFNNKIVLDGSSYRSLLPILQKLEKHRRNTRAHPRVDHKIQASWNGLALAAFAKGASVLEDSRYLQTAQNLAEFIYSQLFNKERLSHLWVKGLPYQDGFLEDYSYVGWGLRCLFGSTQEPRWFEAFKVINKLQHKLFYDPKDRTYYETLDPLPTADVRSVRWLDQALPSPAAVALGNDLWLHTATGNMKQKNLSLGLLNAQYHLRKHPRWYPSLLMLKNQLSAGFKEVVVAQPASKHSSKTKAVILRDLGSNSYQPFSLTLVGRGPPFESFSPLFLGKKVKQNKPTIYICENKVCKFPTTDLQKAVEMIHSIKPLQLGKK
jgi:uncharacterized protein